MCINLKKSARLTHILGILWVLKLDSNKVSGTESLVYGIMLSDVFLFLVKDGTA